MIDPDVAATACPDSPSSPNIIDPCPTSKASRDEAGDEPQACALSGAQDASGSTSGTMNQSISPRSHGAGEASVDAAQDDTGDGPRSSPNIAGGVHVAADDPRPFRGRGEIAHACTHTDADQRWVQTVLDSLRTRSPATREALAKALSDGSGTVTGVGHVSGLELRTRKTAKNEHSKCDQSTDPSAPHVSGTSFFSFRNGPSDAADCCACADRKLHPLTAHPSEKGAKCSTGGCLSCKPRSWCKPHRRINL